MFPAGLGSVPPLQYLKYLPILDLGRRHAWPNNASIMEFLIIQSSHRTRMRMDILKKRLNLWSCAPRLPRGRRAVTFINTVFSRGLYDEASGEGWPGFALLLLQRELMLLLPPPDFSLSTSLSHCACPTRFGPSSVHRSGPAVHLGTLQPGGEQAQKSLRQRHRLRPLSCHPGAHRR